MSKDCFQPIANVVSKIIGENPEMKIDISTFTKQMVEALESGKAADPKVAVDAIFAEVIQNKAIITNLRKQVREVGQNVITNAGKGFETSQDLANEILLSVLDRGIIGQGVSDSLSSQIAAFRGIFAGNFDKIIKDIDIDISEITTNSQFAREVFAYLGDSTAEVSSPKAKEMANGLKKAITEIQKFEVATGLRPENSVGRNLTGKVQIDPIKMNKLNEIGELDSFLDEVIDFDLMAEEASKRNASEMYRKLKKENIVKYRKQILSHHEVAEQKKVRLASQYKKKLGVLNRKLEDLDGRPATPQKLESIEKAQAKYRSDIEDKISRREKKIKEAESKLSKAKRKSEKKIHQTTIDNSKKFITNQKRKLKEVDANTKSRLEEAKTPKPKEGESRAELLSSIDKTKKQIEKLGIKESEIEAKLKEVEARTKELLEDNFSDGTSTIIDRKLFKEDLKKSIIKNGYESEFDSRSLVRFKSDKLSDVIDRLSINDNLKDHFDGLFDSYANAVAKRKMFGSDVSSSISEMADEITKVTGFKPDENIVSRAKELYDPAMQRGGMPSKSARAFKAMRFWVNNTVLGRAFLSMNSENVSMSQFIQKMTGESRTGNTFGGIKRTFTAYINSVAGRPDIMDEAGRAFSESSYALANILPKYSEKLQGRNPYSKWIEKMGKRLSGMQAIDLNQRLFGLEKIRQTLNTFAMDAGDISPSLKATLDQFGFTSADIAAIKEIGGWGGAKTFDYISSGVDSQGSRLTPARKTALRELAIKQESYFDSMSSRLLARNNDRFKLKTGIGVKEDGMSGFMNVIIQYKQIMYEVADNLRMLGVKGDGYQETAELMQHNFFVALAKRSNPMSKEFDIDTMFTVAGIAAANFVNMEIRRRMNNVEGWTSDEYSKGQFARDVIGSFAGAYGGVTVGMESIFTGDFDGKNLSSNFLGPSARNVFHAAEFVQEAAKVATGNSDADLVNSGIRLFNNITPLKTHIVTGQAISATYDFLNSNLNDDYDEVIRKREANRANRGEEVWIGN